MDQKLKPKEVCTLLAAKLQLNQRNPKTGKDNGILFHCPNANCSLEGGCNLYFNGYSNIYQHLMSCWVPDKSEAGIQRMARDAQERRRAMGAAQFAAQQGQKKAPLSEDSKLLFRWINMIIMQGWPLSTVACEMHRDVMKGHKTFSVKIVADAILMLNDIVIQQISKQMKEAKVGAIMHDGWSKYSTHYLCVIGSFVDRSASDKHTAVRFAKKRKTKDGEVDMFSHVKHVMLACSEIPELAVFGEPTELKDKLARNATVSTTYFGAEEHARYIKDVVFLGRLAFTEAEFLGWLICQIADSVSTNISVANILKIFHVNCHSHLLHNEVETMMTATAAMEDGWGNLCAQIHEVFAKVKASNKNTAILRLFTNLRPSLSSPTKWSGKFTMTQKFNKIQDELKQAVDHKDSSLRKYEILSNENSAKKMESALKGIQKVTLKLQKRALPLFMCRKFLKVLQDSANRAKSDPDSAWYNHQLGDAYIGPRSSKLSALDFVTGVEKIQTNNSAQLTAEEMDACACLKKQVEVQEPVAGTGDPVLDDLDKSFMEVENQQTPVSSEYHDCSFIGGSAAEVERVWSEARYILTSQRAKMSTELFEAVMMLRFNREYWDEQTVQDAAKYAKDARAAQEQDAGLLRNLPQAMQANDEHDNLIADIDDVFGDGVGVWL